MVGDERTSLVTHAQHVWFFRAGCACCRPLADSYLRYVWRTPSTLVTAAFHYHGLNGTVALRTRCTALQGAHSSCKPVLLFLRTYLLLPTGWASAETSTTTSSSVPLRLRLRGCLQTPILLLISHSSLCGYTHIGLRSISLSSDALHTYATRTHCPFTHFVHLRLRFKHEFAIVALIPSPRV